MTYGGCETRQRRESGRRYKGRSCELSCISKTFSKGYRSFLQSLQLLSWLRNMFYGNLGTKFFHWTLCTTYTQITFRTLFLQASFPTSESTQKNTKKSSNMCIKIGKGESEVRPCQGPRHERKWQFGKQRKRRMDKPRRLSLKCDGTRAETRFRLSAKRTSQFKLAGASVQSTAGSRGVRISGSNAGCTMFRGSVTVLATHSIRHFPLHFPSRGSPCAITFQLDSTTNGTRPD
jgi:hypothetical protein